MATATATRARARIKVANQVANALAPRPMGQLVDEMFALREKKRELEAQAAKVEAEFKELEELLTERMKKESTEKVSGSKATVSLSSGTVATVDDWDALNAYIKRTGNFQLYQRRVSDAAYRELMESGKKVPGVSPFTKVRLNMRVIG